MANETSLSLADMPPEQRMMTLLRALNAAATTLLRFPGNTTDVFRVYSRQMIQMGIEGTFFTYNATQNILCIQSLNLPPDINSRWQEMTHRLGLNPLQQTFSPEKIPYLAQVITTKQAQLFPEIDIADNGFSISPLTDSELTGKKRVVIVAPFVYEDTVLGLVSVSGSYWTQNDVPLVETIGNQIAVALVNSRLMQNRQQAELKYRHLFEQAPVMYMVTENRDGHPHIVECNEFTTQLLGYSQEELIGQPLARFYTKKSNQELRNGGYQRALNGTFLHEERQLVTRDGRVLETILQALPEYNEQGRVIGTRAMFVDITERKKAEYQLQEYQEQLKKSLEELNILVPASAIIAHTTENQALIHDIAEYMAATFDADGCVLHLPHDSLDLFVPRINLRRMRSMGFIATENTTTLILPSALTQNLLTHKKLLYINRKLTPLTGEEEGIMARHEAKVVLLVPMVSRDTVVALAELYSFRGRAYNQRELLFVQTLADYLATGLENARLFDALRQAKEVLEQRVQERTAELQTRNRELDAFAHTVAHDLQGLLSRIIMYSESLQKEYKHISPDEQKLYLQTILQSGRKMKEIVESLFLLATVSMAQIKIKPLDMPAIVQDVLGRLAEDMQGKQATIQQPQAEAWPTVLGYRPWVEAVWVNYITNALRYGGNTPHITLGFDPDGDGQIRFWVQDEGEGISIEDQGRLFEPLTQLHGQGKGHGLGLSIVKRIVSRLGGTVGVVSQIREGSRFYFTLPLESAGQTV